MPTYHYCCDNCNDNFEIVQSFKDKPLKKCKKCGKFKLHKIYYEPHIFVRLGNSDVKTLGHLGARNFEKDEKAGIIKEQEERRAEAEQKGEKYIGKHKVMKKKKGNAWWRDNNKVDKSLAKLNDKQKEDYIMRGIKP